jgi:hypothetical protein
MPSSALEVPPGAPTVPSAGPVEQRQHEHEHKKARQGTDPYLLLFASCLGASWRAQTCPMVGAWRAGAQHVAQLHNVVTSLRLHDGLWLRAQTARSTADTPTHPQTSLSAPLPRPPSYPLVNNTHPISCPPHLRCLLMPQR